MLFNTFAFWHFFCIFIVLFFANAVFTKSYKTQNLLILLASYYFYAQWDWRFLSLIFISTMVDYYCGLKIPHAARPKLYLSLSIGINLTILGIFKYFNFFINEAKFLLESANIAINFTTLDIILPVGISFYTFQTITYSVDIYRKKVTPTTDLIKFAAFVAFFPQLVAGPIERAHTLLTQFNGSYKFNPQQITEGLRLILFGLFLKVVIADNLAVFVDLYWADYQNSDGGVLLLATLYFAFQIYCDFCGYSTIAIGLAKLLGYELSTNFSAPYFSRNIQDFWHRWHISLSTFFRDYVYIPLGGSRAGQLLTIRNLLITFMLSGLWHGANWTFIVWGIYHGTLLILYNYLKPKFKVGVLPAVICTFAFVCIGWILFRSQSLEQAFSILSTILFNFDFPSANRLGLVFVTQALIIDWFWRNSPRLETYPGVLAIRTIRWSVYTFMLWSIIFYFRQHSGNTFIYFQF